MSPNSPALTELADIVQGAAGARRAPAWVVEPRVAFMILLHLRQPAGRADRPRFSSAVQQASINAQSLTFEYEGEMAADIALDPAITGSAIHSHVCPTPPMYLVMPAVHSASISTRLLEICGAGRTLIEGLADRASSIPFRSPVSVPAFPTSSTWPVWPPMISITRRNLNV
jgi:malate dehydrogenase (oxaloacetate-decarboxylating)(NADP+)